jgi:hypothetical protein
MVCHVLGLRSCNNDDRDEYSGFCRCFYDQENRMVDFYLIIVKVNNCLKMNELFDERPDS